MQEKENVTFSKGAETSVKMWSILRHAVRTCYLNSCNYMCVTGVSDATLSNTTTLWCTSESRFYSKRLDPKLLII